MGRKQNSKFKFKQFDVSHAKSSMKVGTDAVLLGAWVEGSGCAKALDIGTGTGIIPLILAQRFENLFIDAIDIHTDSIEEAKDNFNASSWKDRLSAQLVSLQNFEVKRPQFDLIITNPPYFEAGNLSPIKERYQARHTTTLDYETLIVQSQVLLKESGSLAVVLPYSAEDGFRESCISNGLHLWRRLAFQPKTNKPPERILLQFKKANTAKLISNEVLIHYVSDGIWTENYKNLTRDFYLKI